MKTDVNEINTLRTYLDGVASRANHHAHNVQDVAPAIAGHIIANKDNDPIKIHTVSGDLKNALWVKIRGKDYFFRYDHDTETIQIKDGNNRGTLRHSIDNNTTHAQLTQIFSTL